MTAKVPVSRRALVQRVQRKLRGSDRKLVRIKPWRRRALGEFVIVKGAGIDQRLVSWAALVAYAREIGALKPYEVLQPGASS